MAKPQIHVAGDVCIDVIGIAEPRPATAANSTTANWRLTGEIRTHYSLGGVSLLARMLQFAVPGAEVKGPVLQAPAGLREDRGELTPADMLRLTREDIVHSVLRVAEFKTDAKADKKDLTLRLSDEDGFSGPQAHEPGIGVISPDGSGADFVVLDDSGNYFRDPRNRAGSATALWPAIVTEKGVKTSPVIVHKLHRPLPVAPASANPAEESLWTHLSENHARNRVVVISADDMRQEDALISCGLSWERTAMDVVWQLMNADRWRLLKQTPHLIVRLGLEGAVYWTCGTEGPDDHRAWLIYDPQAIEGSVSQSLAGGMVGYAAAFTSGLVKGLVEYKADPKLGKLTFGAIVQGIRTGLKTSRHILELGFGKARGNPSFQLEELFKPHKSSTYACQPITLIRGAAEPDRGHWRLIDTIFSGKIDLLHRAVGLVAKGVKIKGNEAGTDDERAMYLLEQVPVAVFADVLRAYDRREIESYRALHALMDNYLHITPEKVLRPLSVAVFGPPGAGKSFGVKMVAKQLGAGSPREIEILTYNLSQYEQPEQLAAAFHQVRDVVLRGKIPLVFFDEFDTALEGHKLGWLRCFLSPMQDAEFLDRGTPHPIGQSIFVFAGGTRSTYAEFARPFTRTDAEISALKDRSARRAALKEREDFRDAKGPDFLSRLRGTLDIPGLDLNPEFDAYGPTEAFPCQAAIRLRRANILAYQLGEKAPTLRDASKAYDVSDLVVRALIHLPRFEHGNRSFEALIEMSRLVSQQRFSPSLLPSFSQVGLHANAAQFMQLLAADFPFPKKERETIARSIHDAYRARRSTEPDYNPADPSVKPWDSIADDLKDSNFQQADSIAAKLFSVGLWFRRPLPGASTEAKAMKILEQHRDELAKKEHDRWVAEKRGAGWIAAPDMARESKNGGLRQHNFIFGWEDLTGEIKDLDLDTVDQMPAHLKAAGYEIFVPAR